MKLNIFLLFCSCQLCLSVPAQSYAVLPLNNKLSVLNGKAFFSFPDSTVNKPRQVNLMSAAPNLNDETRLIYHSGKMNLIFFAQELYLLSDKKIFNELSGDSSYAANFSSKEFLQKDSLYAIISTPLRYDSLQGGILIKSLLVQTQDSTLFRIDAYINDAAFPRRAEFQQLAENVFNTLSKGSRTIQRNERDEKYSVGDGYKSFLFHLPANYCITKEPDEDFEIYKFHKLRKFTDNTLADLLIYIGEHPSYMFMEYGLDEHSARRDSGMILGNKIEWLFFNYDMQGIFLKEQMIHDNGIQKGEMVHVAMITNKRESLDELTQIAEEAKLISK